ncbi:MAG: hypothetical protein J6K29_10330 [Clostridia bacterium]|nr:hypothetical protein [Clostridia bacterium]
MNFPDLKPKYVTNIMIRRPYDARADALSYIMRVKVAEEGFVPPPVLGVKITEVGAMPAIKMLEAELEQKDLIPEIREAKTNLIRDLREALETSVMASLYEVGIDANALRYTAELNDALIKENRILKKKLEDEVTRVAVLYEEKDKDLCGCGYRYTVDYVKEFTTICPNCGTRNPHGPADTDIIRRKEG